MSSTPWALLAPMNVESNQPKDRSKTPWPDLDSSTHIHHINLQSSSDWLAKKALKMAGQDYTDNPLSLLEFEQGLDALPDAAWGQDDFSLFLSPTVSDLSTGGNVLDFLDAPHDFISPSKLSHLDNPGTGQAGQKYLHDETFDQPSGLSTPGFESSNDGRPDTPSQALASSRSGQMPPKVGTRFSKESLRVLREWLSSNSRHPFPTDEQRQILEYKTGLTKTQILNWLANARRRGKVPHHGTASPTLSTPIDMPRRPGTPALRDRTSFRNPLERWVDSPPEDEAASAAAIAQAVSSTIFGQGPYDNNLRDQASGSSYRPSPSSSVGTSHSSSGSAYSFDSRDPTSSLGRAYRHRRKRRGHQRRETGKTSLTKPVNTFQCTFCTETFSTKHVWQRHEKSLHLTVESWVCAPDGPITTTSDGTSYCVFCNEPNPDESHIESHNYSVCQTRPVEERTFHRKDHLGQHLRLTHDLAPRQFGDHFSRWKLATPQIRSSCGFCGITMDTWSTRVDHLAEHFKLGCTLADWTGTWGFEPHILARVEHAIPPFMISDERRSPFPFSATRGPVDSPRNAYELIKLELIDFIDTQYERTGKVPSSEELQFDACRIIFAAEIPSFGNPECCSSWLRDLIMSSGEIAQRAKLSPFRSRTESKLAFLGIVGKESPFEGCELETQLLEFVHSAQSPVSDHELQKEVCRIIQSTENMSSTGTDIPAIWLLELARLSPPTWLQAFRRRANIPNSPQAEFSMGVSLNEPDHQASVIDSIFRNYDELERRLTEHVETLTGHGIEPGDSHLRQQSLKIIAEFDNEEWKAAAAKNHSWLARFKRKHLPWASIYAPPKDLEVGAASPAGQTAFPANAAVLGQNTSQGTTSPTCEYGVKMYMDRCFLNDPNLDKWTTRELTRWVAATMSPHNPNQRTPSDEELQHQARWFMYGDGDPFNQTLADNAEWLRRFKRHMGILKDVGPGLSGL